MISQTFIGLILTGLAYAGVVPTAPGPGQSFNEGADCTLSWNLDTTGKWKSFSVDLMSGSNTAMQPVTNVFKDRDGTQGATSYTWKCPAVTPNSAIYFYQFSQDGEDTTWTTRFTIASASGQTTPPANPTQPVGGAAIPWGIGKLTSGGATPAATANNLTSSPAAGANTTALTTPAGNTSPSVVTSSNAVTNSSSTSTTPAMTSSTSSLPVQSISSNTDSTKSTTSSSSSSSPKSGTTSSGSTTSSSTNTTSTAMVLTPKAIAATLVPIVLAVLACK